MEYKIGNKKIYVFISHDCDSDSYRANTGAGGEWDAIILEENGDTKMVYFKAVQSKEECEDTCRKKFEELYPGEPWRY